MVLRVDLPWDTGVCAVSASSRRQYGVGGMVQAQGRFSCV